MYKFNTFPESSCYYGQKAFKIQYMSVEGKVNISTLRYREAEEEALRKVYMHPVAQVKNTSIS